MPKTSSKHLVRPVKGRMIAGVAAGLADYFDVDVTLVRIVWVLLFIPGGAPGLVPYLLMWLIMPEKAK